MCYGKYERRRRDAEASREMWRDFDRTEPVRDAEPRDETPDREPAEARDPVTTVER